MLRLTWLIASSKWKREIKRGNKNVHTVLLNVRPMFAQRKGHRKRNHQRRGSPWGKWTKIIKDGPLSRGYQTLYSCRKMDEICLARARGDNSGEPCVWSRRDCLSRNPVLVGEYFPTKTLQALEDQTPNIKKCTPHIFYLEKQHFFLIAHLAPSDFGIYESRPVYQFWFFFCPFLWYFKLGLHNVNAIVTLSKCSTCCCLVGYHLKCYGLLEMLQLRSLIDLIQKWISIYYIELDNHLLW